MAEDDAIQLDVNDFSDNESQAETQDSTPTDSSTEDTKKTEVVDDGFDQTEDKSEEEADEPEEKQDDQPVEKESSDAEEDDKPRAKNSSQERIRSLANENRELRRQIEQVNAQHYQPQTAQELIDQGEDPARAEIEAFRQEQSIRDYNQRIVQTTTDLNMEAQQVMHDFPVFDSNSPEYDEEFANKVNAQYQKIAGIKTDPKTGAAYDVNVLPYEFYQSYVEARSHGQKRGDVEGKKAAEKQMAAVEAPSSAPQRSPKKDAFMEGFDSI